MLKKNLLFLFAFLMVSLLNAQDIATEKAKGAGTKVTVKGVINCDSEFGAPLRYIQDATGGLAVYSDSVKNFKLGDSVSITGTLKDYNNLLEMDPVTATVSYSSGLTVSPLVLLPVNAFVEKYEGKLIQLTKVKFSKTGSFSTGNYYVKAGKDSFQVRINAALDLIGAPIPTDSVNITGVMSQFKTTYQLLIRGRKDLATGNGPGFETNLIQTNIKETSFDISFKTVKKGNTILRYGLTKALELGTITDTTQSKNHKTSITGLNDATFYYVMATTKNSTGDSNVSNLGLFSTKSKSKGNMKPYFDNTVDTTKAIVSKANQLYYTVDDSLVAWIGRAKTSIDFAIYSFDNKNFSANVSTALNTAFKNGVKVRVVSDGSNKNPGLAELDSKIPVKRSPTAMKYGIMHNKFLIIDVNSVDNSISVAGSTNITDNQIYTDRNNLIVIQDQAVAKAYTLEFEEMFTDGKFGVDKTDNTPHKFNVGGTEVELFFSPSDGVTSQAVRTINKTQNELYFAFNLITRSEVASAIASKGYSKLFVQGVIGDTSLQASNTPFKTIQKAIGSNVRKDGKSGIFHHKYFIVDQSESNGSEAMVFTGSYNFSTAAEATNDENVLIIHSKDVANQYFQEFSNRYKENGGTGLYTSINDFEATSNGIMRSVRFTDNELVLNYSSTQNLGNTTFRVIDMKGNVIAQFNRNVVNGDNMIQENITVPNTGIYIISAVSINGKSVNLKVNRF